MLVAISLLFGWSWFHLRRGGGGTEEASPNPPPPPKKKQQQQTTKKKNNNKKNPGQLPPPPPPPTTTTTPKTIAPFTLYTGILIQFLICIGCVYTEANWIQIQTQTVDCDADSNPDSGPYARVNTPYESLNIKSELPTNQV